MSLLPYQLDRIVVTQRQFQGGGELRVSLGQYVEPDTLLGVERRSRQPIVVDVASALATSPMEARAALVVSAGERVSKGEILARAGGPKPRECRAPVAGLMASFDSDTGLATLLPAGEEQEVRAQIPGVVTQIVSGRGVGITTTGACITGAWGVGGPAYGVVRLAEEGRGQVLTAEEITHRFTYSILVTGGPLTAALVRKAAAVEAAAVVGAGMSTAELASLYTSGKSTASLPEMLRGPLPAVAKQPKLPVIVLLGGFESRSVPELAWRVLLQCQGKVGGLDAPGGAARPRLVVQFPRHEVSHSQPPVDGRLEQGSTVLVVAGAHLGETAVVQEYPAFRVRLGSGVSTEGVLVELEGGGTAVLPSAHVQVIENAP